MFSCFSRKRSSEEGDAFSLAVASLDTGTAARSNGKHDGTDASLNTLDAVSGPQLLRAEGRPSNGAASDLRGCPLMHGTVYDGPFPGYVHGTNPEICRHGCKPVRRDDLGETDVQRLKREAIEFIDQFHHELERSDEEKEARKAEVVKLIDEAGTYEHTYEELQWGIRCAWRNAPKCANRKFWDEIVLLDHRHARTAKEMLDGCLDLLERATHSRATVPYLCAFKPHTPGEQDGPRVWNSQLMRFACYEQANGTLLGDPANEAFTKLLLDEFGWTPPEEKTAFDVLPLVLQASPESEPQLFELPPWYVSTVSITHQAHPWLKDMGLKWYAIPAVSAMELWLGGLSYSAVPFSGWYADTEVVRDLTDECRYNLVKPLGEKMGLDTRSNATLWKDAVMKLVNEAVLYSFQSAGWAMVDHHTLLQGFWGWYNKEIRTRGYCPGNWKWIIPPLNPTLTPCYLQLNKMTEYTLLPAYVYAPSFKHFFSLLKKSRQRQSVTQREGAPAVAPRASGGKALPFNVYFARMVGWIKLRLRQMRPCILILFSTVTGNTKALAFRLATLLSAACTVSVLSMEDFDEKALNDATLVIQMSSTYGSGAAPSMARKYLSFLNSAEGSAVMAGKLVTTLGLGSTQYPRFCAAADLLAQQARNAGAATLLRTGKCDANGLEESDFRLWASALLGKLHERKWMKDGVYEQLSAQVDVSKNSTEVQEEVFNVVRAPGLKQLAQDFTRYVASVKQVRRLVGEPEPRGTNDVPRCTTSIVIDLSELPFLQYEPGDHFAVYPENDANAVKKVCKHLGITEADMDCPFIAESSSELAPVPFPSPTTFRTALTNYLDLNAKPSTMALAVFAKTLEDAGARDTARELRKLAEDSNAYSLWLQDSAPRWSALWDAYPELSDRLSVARCFELIPLTAPRYYSISSSMLKEGNEVVLTVGLLSFMEHHALHKGTASGFLTSCSPGDRVMFSIVRAPSFYMPMQTDANHPSLYVCAGTGIAPFRSFWQERKARAKYVTKLPPAILVYGCRTEEDVCYASELVDAVESGVLTRVIFCFSRQPGQPKRYVQDGIRENGDDIKALLEKSGAHYYMCGDVGMASEVAAAVQKIVGNVTVSSMANEGRWHEDIFGNKKAVAGTNDRSALDGQHSREGASKLAALERAATISQICQAIRDCDSDKLPPLFGELSRADRAWRDSDGRGFLHIAVLERAADVIPTLHEQMGGDGTGDDKYSMTPLLLARTLGMGECVRALEDAGLQAVSGMNKRFFPVHSSALLGETAAVESALAAGFSILRQDAGGNFLLHCAVASGRSDVVAAVLKATPNAIHLRNRYSVTATEMAAALNLQEILAQLRRAGGKASAGEGLNANYSVSVTAATTAHETGVPGLGLSAQQLAAIQAAWAAVSQADFPGAQGSKSTDVGVKMFHTLFEQDPVLLDLFPFKDASGKPIEKELRVHAAKVVTSLGSVIDALSDPATVAVLDQLVRSHMKYGVKEMHYTAVFSALVSTLEQELAVAWTEDVVMAWNTLFDSMQGLVTSVYKDIEDEAS